jgi:hypothetical protein
MSIILPTLAVGFAAFCVWLTVRIVNRRERWAKLTGVALVVLVAYPLSIGPVPALHYHLRLSKSLLPAIDAFYWPLIWLEYNGPEQVRDLISWYVRLWI